MGDYKIHVKITIVGKSGTETIDMSRNWYDDAAEEIYKEIVEKASSAGLYIEDKRYLFEHGYVIPPQS